MRTRVYLNLVSTAVPPHECHREFATLLPDLVAPELREKITSIVPHLGIEKRYTVLRNAFAPRDGEAAFYGRDRAATTFERMRAYREHALPLAGLAIKPLLAGTDRGRVTHLVFASCTGFYAPGPDIGIVKEFGLSPTVKRSIIGFMGCYAAVPALRCASDIVVSDPSAHVLVVNLELCSLHFRRDAPLDQLVTFLLFADGCSAALVSAEPRGIRLDSFRSEILPGTPDHMRWAIGDDGFAMRLDPQIPSLLKRALRSGRADILAGRRPDEFSSWAAHPGGRGILDAVRDAFELPDEALASARGVLKNFGNMSSATVMFVLRDILSRPECRGPGCGMAFGPGLSLESFLYHHEG